MILHLPGRHAAALAQRLGVEPETLGEVVPEATMEILIEEVADALRHPAESRASGRPADDSNARPWAVA